MRCLLFCILICLTCVSAGLGKDSRIRLEVPESDYEYNAKSGVLETFGRARIWYEGQCLEADRIRMDKKSGDIWLQGDVIITGGKYRLETPFVLFNSHTERGYTGPISGKYGGGGRPTIISGGAGGETSMGPFFLQARSGDLGRNEFGLFRIRLISPSFTDCTHKPPLHDLRASTATLSAGEKVELWNTTPRIFKVPYGYAPYLIRDLQYDWPWTSWGFGRNAKWGYFGTMRTHLLPDTLGKRSVLGLEDRQERGIALKQDWNYTKKDLNNSLRTHYFREKWHSLNSDSPEIVEDRIRTDFYHRQKIKETWTATVEHHYLPARKTYFWDNGATRVLSPNRFASPIPGGRQERESLLQDYYNEEFRTGRTLEDSLSLEYHRGRSFAVVSTDMRSDTEISSSPMREIELKGRLLPSPVKRTSFLYSNEYGVGRMGIHISEEMSDDDKRLAFGRTDLHDFLGWRFNYRQKVERNFRLGDICSLTPFVGSSHLSYEKTLKTPGVQVWNIRDQDLDEWHQNHRFLSGALLSNTTTGYFSPGPRRFKHVIGPSIQTEFISPSAFTRDYVPAKVDQLDDELNPRLRVVYRLDNQVYTKTRSEDSRLFLASTAQYTFLGRHLDNLRSYGPGYYGGANAEFDNAVYPVKPLKLSSELRVNTFHNQVYQHRDGFELGRDRFSFSWYFLHIHNPQAPLSSIDRHDFSLRWGFPSKTDLRAGLSYDPNPPEAQRQGLYRHGFKTMDLAVTQIYYSLRWEIRFSYDVQASGATLLFSFGPRILGRNIPFYRTSF